MNLFELTHIDIDLNVKSKSELFSFIAEKLFELNRVTARDQFEAALLKREKEITTGIGDGIAIPHAKDISVLFPTLLYIKLADELAYDALDDLPVKEVFVIAMPNSYNKEHLTVLSKIAKMLLVPEIKEKLKKLQSKHVLFELISHGLQKD